MKLRKLIALAATLALAGSMSGTALADQGGVPHSDKPCPTKDESKKPKKEKKAPKNTNGKKCGHQKTPPVEETPPVVEE